MPDIAESLDLLQSELFLGNSYQQWAIALVVAVGIGLALYIAKKIVSRHTQTLAARHPSDWLDALVDLIRNTRRWSQAALAACGGAAVLHLPEQYDQTLKTAVIIVLLVQSALWGDVLIRSYFMRQAKRRAETDASGATTMIALTFLGRIAIWTVMVLLILTNLGIDITAMIAGLGIGGVAVALAAQSVLGDLFASASIVLDQPFVLGDFIIVGTDMGTVEYIGLKTTRVRSLSGEQLVFGNGDLLKSRIRNFKRMNERRIVFSLGVAYETPAETVAAIPAMLREIVESQSAIRFDRSHFKQYGDSALIFEVVYIVLSADYKVYMDIQQEVNLAIFRRFAEERISFAYPTQTVYLHNERRDGMVE